MQVPEGIRKCVAFVGLKMADGTHRMAGTAFFVTNSDDAMKETYIVTAKHVIEGIKSKGVENCSLRLNTTTGEAIWDESDFKDWIYHPDPTVDIALAPIVLTTIFDHQFLPIQLALTQQAVMEEQIDVGDEVFITGLFTHHHGTKKNIPIVRVGNIASITEEKIQTENHLMDGYLIEARSIGGLSGSPVFVNLGVVRSIQGKFQQSKGAINYYLMGLIYGHYDDKSLHNESKEGQPVAEISKINTGIAIVTPIQKLLDIFNTV